MITREKPGAEDFVDPAAGDTMRLSRRNILALVLTVAGVILALFFSSRRTPAPRRADPIPDRGTVAPITIGGPDLMPPAPEAAPASGPWRSAPVQPSTGSAADQRRQTHFDEALRARPLVHAAGTAPQEEVAGASEAPDSPAFTVRESTVIEAALESALHSDRPGPVIARVVRPVRDSAQLQHILIPAGTRLSGTMQPVHTGTGPRVVVSWTRMEFPDGRIRALPALPAIESSGEHGLADRVNRHRVRAAGNAALLALLGGSSTYASARAGLAGASLALELSRIGHGQLQQHRGRTPTVTVRAGYRFLIYVSEDLHFEAPYR